MGLKGDKWYGTFIDGVCKSYIFWPELQKKQAKDGTRFAMRVPSNKGKKVRLVELTVTRVIELKEKP